MYRDIVLTLKLWNMYYTYCDDIAVKKSDGEMISVLFFLSYQYQQSVPRDWVNDNIYLHYIIMFKHYLHL